MKLKVDGPEEKKSIKELVQFFNDGEYQIDSRYQRDDLAWKLKQKREFINNLFDYPLTTIILDARPTNPCTYVIDGQQRLTALKEYILDDFKFSRSYRSLNAEERNFLLNIQCPVKIINTGTDEDVITYYQIVNAGKPLNSAEVRKAMNMDLNEFIDSVYRNNDFFKNTDFKDPINPPFIKFESARCGWRSIIESSLLVFKKNSINVNFGTKMQYSQAKHINKSQLSQKYVTDMLDSFSYLAKGINILIGEDVEVISKARKKGKKGLLGKSLITHAVFTHHKITRMNKVSLEGRGADFARFFLEVQALNSDEQLQAWLRADDAGKMRKLHNSLYKNLTKRLDIIASKAA